MLRARPAAERCVRPFHDRRDINCGGPHGHGDAIADIDGGKMDGFVAAAPSQARRATARLTSTDPRCSSLPTRPDVMGYHDRREIPNYWDYAENFVLQDHMFEPVTSWSLPAHLFMVSAWSARCTKPAIR